MPVPRTDRLRRDEHWFRLKVGAPVHERVVAYGKALLVREASFHSKNLRRERIYRGVDLSDNKAALSELGRGGRGIARLNFTKAICDTFSSRLSKDRPMPGLVTDGSDWETKQQAKKFRAFIVGQMLETEFDNLSRRALHDGTRLGSGFTRIDATDDAVYAERIPINDLLFDRRECKYGRPQQAIRIQRVSKTHLEELFPRAAKAGVIERAPSSLRRKDDSDVDSDGPRSGDLDDYVDTWEAWHLPTTADSDDGRRVLCIDGTSPECTLVSEQWHEPRFPWTQFQLQDPDWGIYPEGFVDQLIDLQYRVNCIVRDIQLNLAATGRGFFLTNKANDIPVEMLTGFQPYKVSYNGPTPPTWVAPTSVNPAQVSLLDKFIEEGFSITGVSRANSESKSQLGAGASGVALDTQYDIDSDRFRMPQANYAKYRLNGAQCYLDASARVARAREDGKGKKKSWVTTSWDGRDSIEQLEYSKVALKTGKYRLRIEPIGFLPDTRAGKLSVVEQLAKAGVIPQWLVPMLFDEPDLQEMNLLILAPIKNALRKMDECMHEDLPLPQPEQYNDLDVELKVATAYYNWIQCEKAPPEIQERFRMYCDLVVDQLKLKSPPAPPALPMAPPEQPLPGGLPPMPQGPVPAPQMIGAPPQPMLPPPQMMAS